MPDTIYLKNYSPAPFQISTVNLNFDLYDEHTIVTNTIVMTRSSPGSLHLLGDELELISLKLNGRRLISADYILQDNSLIIDSCPNEFSLEIITRIYPHLNTKLSGLYRSNDLFCTQCEAEGFRRMSYFLDRPDVLATYETKITADKTKYPVLLSNGNLLESGETPDGRHWVIWKDPFKKPSYLFALVAGNLACVTDTFKTCTGASVKLCLYVEPGNEDKCMHALNSLKKAMAWDEKVYARVYDLDIYMIVAVSDFNMGAMENKGLNIFNSKYILANPQIATDQDYADIEGVVGHEYFHNWTGNRVTCRDWFQLSLKEGLTVFRDQEFSRDMNSRDVFRIMDVKSLRINQFPEDAGSMAHPVRPESYQEISNFYTATIYNKGAEVIRMQNTLLGQEGFRKGMDLYFQRYDGEAVTIDDFVGAMADANAVDLNQFKLWYSQAGTPEVHVKSTYLQECLSIHMQQSCPKTPDGKDKRPLHIPIKFALFDPQGTIIPVEKDLLELKEREQTFIFKNLKERPTVSLLREFSAPIQLYDDLSQEDLLFLLKFEADGFAKWEASSRLVINALKQCLKDKNKLIPEELFSAFEHILQDESLDNHLRAELLTPPAFEEIAIHLKSIDVDAVEQVRDSFRSQMGKRLHESLLALYKKLWQEEDHAMHGIAFGRRKLRNICLWLLMKSNETEHMALSNQQFEQAKTMTDELAAFALLVNCSKKTVREGAIQSFYEQWSQSEVVMDKWFSIQASSELSNSLSVVKKLLDHPQFSMKNPNKVRALIGSFCLANPRNFHTLDGSGYLFLTEMLQILDKINPQIAARLASPFSRWQQFDKPRRTLMWQQLERLAQSKLSHDLREIVDKSLEIEKATGVD